jgi:DNA repair protein RecN (Recombination protein N)
LASARETLEANQQSRDRLIWQISEGRKVSPDPNEWEDLNSEHRRLANAYSLIGAAKAVLETLEADDGGVVSNLARSRNVLSDVMHFDQGLAHPCELLESCVVQAQEAARSLNAYLRHTDVDPDRYAKLDERLSLWISTARRFRIAPNELPITLSRWETELAELNESSDLGRLETEERDAHQRWFKLASEISAARAGAATNLGTAVTAAMQELGMPGGKFEVELERSVEPSSNGFDDVSFLVAAHPGSTPRPIQKIASGGELSRIALAIAVTTSQLGVADTLVFDEVDSGVGGAVAEAVGQLLRRLGADRQVLVVTHLPQVAACANQHFVVSKISDKDGVQSQVGSVDGKLRVLEIARMLGGEVISDATLAHAAEMLRFSDKKSQGKRIHN